MIESWFMAVPLVVLDTGIFQLPYLMEFLKGHQLLLEVLESGFVFHGEVSTHDFILLVRGQASAFSLVDFHVPRFLRALALTKQHLRMVNLADVVSSLPCGF